MALNPLWRFDCTRIGTPTRQKLHALASIGFDRLFCHGPERNWQCVELVLRIIARHIFLVISALGKPGKFLAGGALIFDLHQNPPRHQSLLFQPAGREAVGAPMSQISSIRIEQMRLLRLGEDER
ncbi:hypothetical protein GN316_20045 [Xylophilus sp. Kf1]|nr:hypothetical protein [Xylophilus sp. Kf1]